MATFTNTLPFYLATIFLILHFHYSAAQNVVRAVYWFPASEFPVASIDSTLFTHIFCAFADLDSQTNQVTISSANQAQFSTFTQTVQKKNPSVKTLLSVGGGAANPDLFASMASQASTRKSFIDSSINLARSNGFHGLDLDWEYPSTATQMTNFGLLVNEWKTGVSSEASRTGRTPLLLTAAVFRSADYYTLNYPFQAIKNSLNWINVMAYDFYGPTFAITNVTEPPAALYTPGSKVSGDYGINTWIQAGGIASTKLVLGLPFYGYAWKLLDSKKNGIFAPAKGAAISTDGSVGYSEIKDLISQQGFVTVYNQTFVSNYCYLGTTWIGYDDTQSISTKVEYAKNKRLLGYFAWHVGADYNWILSKQALQAWGVNVLEDQVQKASGLYKHKQSFLI